MPKFACFPLTSPQTLSCFWVALLLLVHPIDSRAVSFITTLDSDPETGELFLRPDLTDASCQASIDRFSVRMDFPLYPMGVRPEKIQRDCIAIMRE